jgi:hypothetical protein
MVICRCSLCCDTLLWTSTVPDLRTARTYRHTARTYVSVYVGVCVCVNLFARTHWFLCFVIYINIIKCIYHMYSSVFVCATVCEKACTYSFDMLRVTSMKGSDSEQRRKRDRDDNSIIFNSIQLNLIRCNAMQLNNLRHTLDTKSIITISTT